MLLFFEYQALLLDTSMCKNLSHSRDSVWPLPWHITMTGL